MGTEKNKGAVDIEPGRHLWKKVNSRFSRNGKFPLFKERQKCHHLASRRVFSLQQLSSLIHAVIRNGAVVRILFRNFHMFIRLKVNRKRLLFIFLGPRTLLQFCRPTLGKSEISTLRDEKQMQMAANVVVLIVSPPKSIMKNK